MPALPVTLNTITHHVEGAEANAPLVIAHGLFGSARNFNTLARKLATNRSVIMVDMRNHGESPWDDDASYAAMASDLAVLIETECSGRAVVLGHSMGGKATMALALTRPELVAGAIVADIAPVAYTHSHLGFVQSMRALDLAKISRRSDADPYLALAIPEAPLRAFILQNLVIEEGVARWRLNLKALEEGMDGLTGWPADLDSERYTGPALFLSGGNSTYMTPEFEPEAQNLFPMADFQVIPGAGHWLHAEKPAEFLASISSWLGLLDEGALEA